MKHYVLCYAQAVPSSRLGNDVLFIERRKNDWQFGKLNLPGGSVNPGELPESAAFRELLEETGLVASKPDIQVLGCIAGDDWFVDVCFCPYRPRFNGVEQSPRTLTTEGEILTLPWREAIHDPRLIPNLRIIIPFCQARADGWQLNRSESQSEWIVGLADTFRGKTL